MNKYLIIVDGHKVATFEHPMDIPERMQEEIAGEWAADKGIKSFGLKGIEVRKQN